MNPVIALFLTVILFGGLFVLVSLNNFVGNGGFNMGPGGINNYCTFRVQVIELVIITMIVSFVLWGVWESPVFLIAGIVASIVIIVGEFYRAKNVQKRVDDNDKLKCTDNKLTVTSILFSWIRHVSP
jgi:hypothetical protein